MINLKKNVEKKLKLEFVKLIIQNFDVIIKSMSHSI